MNVAFFFGLRDTASELTRDNHAYLRGLRAIDYLDGTSITARPVLVIGHCENDDTLIVMDIINANPGRVSLFDNYVEDSVTVLAESLPTFLAMLHPTRHLVS